VPHHAIAMTIEEGALRRAVSTGSAAHQVRFLGFAGGRTDHPRFLNMGCPMSPTRRPSDATLIASSRRIPKLLSFLDMAPPGGDKTVSRVFDCTS
ncbi:MAG TPA: hypothetical protein VLT82_16080, partial [Myxococcaceae bacterium]|nr:hypothetical protein [Myxococcaceae bacterium]